MTKINKQAVVDVLNNLEIIEQNGGDDVYLLVENSPDNHKRLNAVGVLSETINKYCDGEKETFCILTLGFSEGYVDMFIGDKLICFDSSVEFTLSHEVHRSIQPTTNTSHIDSTLNTINAVNIASSVPSERCDSYSSSYDSSGSSDSSSSSSCD